MKLAGRRTFPEKSPRPLCQKRPTFLAAPPSIEKAEILAAKLPGGAHKAT